LRHTNCGTRTPSSWRVRAFPLIVIQRRLGHTNLGITSVYLQGIDNTEILDAVHSRRAPMVPVHSSLQV
jgi:integrase/recombinase XerD